MLKKIILSLVVVLFVAKVSHSQAWLTSLEIAQKLAIDQNKMIFMVWEGATQERYEVLISNKFIENKTNGSSSWSIIYLFTNEDISPVVWEYFVPVIVSESQYDSMYAKINMVRNDRYKEKFNDNSIKILDPFGNILNVYSETNTNGNPVIKSIQNIDDIITGCVINPDLVQNEWRAYGEEKNFYSAYYLAEKYLNLALYAEGATVINMSSLSRIYLDESRQFLESSPIENKSLIEQRVDLLQYQQDLMLKEPVNRVIKKLKRLDKMGIEHVNASKLALLFYVSYAATSEMDKANHWKSKITSLDFKKAQKIIDIIKSQ